MLRRGFAYLAGVVAAALAGALAWLRSRRITRLTGTDLQADPGELPMVMWPTGRIAVPMCGHTDRFACPGFEVVEVEPAFGEPQYAAVFAQLTAGPGSKLLDLRAANDIKMHLFERLAIACQGRCGGVPRLGIVLPYESWTVLHRVAVRRLQPIADQGTQVEVFYPAQIQSLPAWFADGQVRHDHLRDVIEWLRTQWRPTAIWPTVLGTTAMLVQTFAETDAVTDMLLELAAIASSFDGADGAGQATRYARAALSEAGNLPSRARCRALRALASATMRQGEAAAALDLLELAITVATLIRDPIEEAAAETEIGFQALRSGHLARAEARFRSALAILAAEELPYLRATLHHHLALVLVEQNKDADEAEHHAAAALALRWDKTSQLASEDRALLARIQCRGHRTEHEPHGSVPEHRSRGTDDG